MNGNGNAGDWLELEGDNYMDDPDGHERVQRLPLLTGIEAPSVTVANESFNPEDHLENARPRSGMRSAFRVYEPGVTPRNVNAPFASVTEAAASICVSEVNSSAPAGRSRTPRLRIGPSGPITVPDTRTDGSNFSCKSIRDRSSPEASVIGVACAITPTPG